MTAEKKPSPKQDLEEAAKKYQVCDHRPFEYECRRHNHNHGHRAQENESRGIYQQHRAFVGSLRGGDDPKPKSRSPSRNSNERKPVAVEDKLNFKKVSSGEAVVEAAAGAKKGPAIKNSMKYKKNIEVIPQPPSREKSAKERSRSKTRGEELTERFEISQEDSSRNTLTSSPDKASARHKLRKERSEEFGTKMNDHDAENQEQYRQTAAIERGEGSIGVNFTKAKQEASRQASRKSPSGRLSVKEKEIAIDFTAERDTSGQEQLDGKSGSELPGHSNWVPINGNSKESMDKIDNDYKDLQQENPEDPYYLHIPEGVNCTQSSVLRPPGGLTLLDDEDGFLAKDIFAALESVQKGFKEEKSIVETAPIKKGGLKGNIR